MGYLLIIKTKNSDLNFMKKNQFCSGRIIVLEITIYFQK